ncbi:hypothetical protein AOLI_G00215080 [Acnodon oligacanthus]
MPEILQHRDSRCQLSCLLTLSATTVYLSGTSTEWSLGSSINSKAKARRVRPQRMLSLATATKTQLRSSRSLSFAPKQQKREAIGARAYRRDAEVCALSRQKAV